MSTDEPIREVALERVARLAGLDQIENASRRRDVIEPDTDTARLTFTGGPTMVTAAPREWRITPGGDDGGRDRRRRSRRPRRSPRGLMELEMVATAFVDQATVRSEQRESLLRTVDAVEHVADRLRRQSEETMLDGLQGDPARVAYLTLALHLRDTADAAASSLRGLELAEQAMLEANEEFRRIEKMQLAPGHRSVLALGEPVAIAGVGTLSPAAAEKHWMQEVGAEQTSAAQRAMARFQADMAQAATLMRTVEVPAVYQDGRVADEPIIVDQPAIVAEPETTPEDAEAAPAAPSLAGGGAVAGAAAGGAARFASSRSGGGHRSAGASGAAAAAPRDTWVSTRHLHDTGPDGSMTPAGPSAAGASLTPSVAATAAAAGGVALPAAGGAGGAGGSTGGEEESGTAIVRPEQEEAAAAAIVSAASASGSRESIPTAPAVSNDW